MTYVPEDPKRTDKLLLIIDGVGGPNTRRVDFHENIFIFFSPGLHGHPDLKVLGHPLLRTSFIEQLGGILVGAGGTVLVHVGDGDDRLRLLREAIEHSELPARVLFPTHVNRSTALLDEAAEWTLVGGFVDITVSTTPELIAAGDIEAFDALRRLVEAGASPSQITCSSDAGGSLPLYVDGQLKGLTAAEPSVLLGLLMQLHRQDSDLFPLALAAMTVNPAAALGLAGLGQLEVGADADFILVDGDSGIVTDVCCSGRWLLRDGSVCSV